MIHEYIADSEENGSKMSDTQGGALGKVRWKLTNYKKLNWCNPQKWRKHKKSTVELTKSKAAT